MNGTCKLAENAHCNSMSWKKKNNPPWHRRKLPNKIMNVLFHIKVSTTYMHIYYKNIVITSITVTLNRIILMVTV